MFRITCFVEDKHLSKVLHALAGHAFNVDTQPVQNAAVKSGKVVQDGGDKPQHTLVLELLSKSYKPGQTFTSSAVSEVFSILKIRPQNKWAVLTKLRKDKLITAKGKGVYALR